MPGPQFIQEILTVHVLASAYLLHSLEQLSFLSRRKLDRLIRLRCENHHMGSFGNGLSRDLYPSIYDSACDDFHVSILRSFVPWANRAGSSDAQRLWR